MPRFDPETHLKSQGWKGKGTALNERGLKKPISVRQKKNLGGVGGERDVGYAFWDHVFTAAASAIQITPDVATSSTLTHPSTSTGTPAPAKSKKVELLRTTTGIISPHAPSTPIDRSPSPEPTELPKSSLNLSIIHMAQREEARRGLYSKFRKGKTTVFEPFEDKPVVEVKKDEVEVKAPVFDDGVKVEDLFKKQKKDERKRKKKEGENLSEKKEKKKRKREEVEPSSASSSTTPLSDPSSSTPKPPILSVSIKKVKKKSKLSQLMEPSDPTSALTDELTTVTEAKDKKKKKDKKRKFQDGEEGAERGETKEERKLKKERKKQRLLAGAAEDGTIAT